MYIFQYVRTINFLQRYLSLCMFDWVGFWSEALSGWVVLEVRHVYFLLVWIGTSTSHELIFSMFYLFFLVVYDKQHQIRHPGYRRCCWWSLCGRRLCWWKNWKWSMLIMLNFIHSQSHTDFTRCFTFYYVNEWCLDNSDYWQWQIIFFGLLKLKGMSQNVIVSQINFI